MAAAESTKLLLAEDDQSVREALERALTFEGYAVSYTHLTLPTTPYV